MVKLKKHSCHAKSVCGDCFRFFKESAKYVHFLSITKELEFVLRWIPKETTINQKKVGVLSAFTAPPIPLYLVSNLYKGHFVLFKDAALQG